jgi:hypothetical protein
MHHGNGSSMRWRNPIRAAVFIGGGRTTVVFVGSGRTDGGGLRWLERDLPAMREREEGEERPNQR